MSDNYQVIYLKENENIYWSLFSLIKNDLDFLNPLYSKEYFEHFVCKAIGEDFTVEDKSFIIIFNGKPFFAFLGCLFIKKEIKYINCFEIPSLCIESKYLSLSKKKQIQKVFNDLLEINFEFFSLTGPSSRFDLPYICEKFLEDSKTDLIIKPIRIIDLRNDISSIKKSLRKSYHSLINWGLREMQLYLYDYRNIKWDTILKFRELHIKEAGRNTRSLETWEKQYESIISKKGFCITAFLNNEFVSAAFFLCSDHYCYYGSSVSKRKLFNFPISHALLWNAILYAKDNGALIFDFGDTYLESLNSNKTEKEKNISYFKKGFGGNLMLTYEVVKK